MSDPQAEMETWVEWMQRTTGWAEDELKKLKIEDWMTQQKRAHWRWAGHITRLTDDRWTARALMWSPTDGKRKVGRQKKRWVDDINSFVDSVADPRHQKQLRHMLTCAGSGVGAASDPEKARKTWRRLWKRHEDAYASAKQDDS